MSLPSVAGLVINYLECLSKFVTELRGRIGGFITADP